MRVGALWDANVLSAARFRPGMRFLTKACARVVTLIGTVEDVGVAMTTPMQGNACHAMEGLLFGVSAVMMARLDLNSFVGFVWSGLSHELLEAQAERSTTGRLALPFMQEKHGLQSCRGQSEGHLPHVQKQQTSRSMQAPVCW